MSRAEACALIRAGDAKKARGDLEGALDAYQKARALAPENPHAHNSAALMLKALNRPGEAAALRQTKAVAMKNVLAVWVFVMR